MLNKAWNSVLPSTSRRWSKIATLVEGKTAQQCSEKWDSKNEGHIKGINLILFFIKNLFLKDCNLEFFFRS